MLAGQTVGRPARNGRLTHSLASAGCRKSFRLGLLQLVPWNSKTNGVLSPSGARLSCYLAVHGTPGGRFFGETLGVAAIKRQPLSLYPASTRHDLAMLTLAAVVFRTGRRRFFRQAQIAGLRLARCLRSTVLRLLFSASCSSSPGMVCSIGRSLYVAAVARSAPLSIETTPVGFESLLARRGVHDDLGGRPPQDEVVRTPSGFPRGSIAGWGTAGAGYGNWLLRLNAATLSAVILMVYIVAGILCSLSRGAFLAMIGATVITVLAVSCAQRRIVGGWHLP